MSQTNTSPCSYLNSDVLREIFTHCTIHAGADYHSKNISTCFTVFGRNIKPSIREFPQLNISKVCALWRDIALRTPQLWDNIYIGDFTEANLSIAREYLLRAKDYPVSITIRQGWLLGKDLHPQESQLTDFLSSYRIRTLTLTAVKVIENMLRFHLVLLDLPQRSVEDLESLSILTDTHGEEVQIDFNDTRYPKLVDVCIWGAYKISSFNSSSLRVFNGMWLSMTVPETWVLLSRCPSLEESRLKITQVIGGQRPLYMPQIHLRRLRKLELHSKSEILFSTFIEVLTLPVVEKLHVVDGWSATAFQSLAHRSNYFPRLVYFNLRTTQTTAVDAGTLLALMPRLTIIYLPDISTIFDQRALNGLASGSLAPRLQILSVGRISNPGQFLDMVESRMKNAQLSSNRVLRFKKIVFLGYYQDHSDRLRLRDMKKRGIPIHDYTLDL